MRPLGAERVVNDVPPAAVRSSPCHVGSRALQVHMLPVGALAFYGPVNDQQGDIVGHVDMPWANVDG